MTDPVLDVAVCLLLMSMNIDLVVTADADADTGLDGDVAVDTDGVVSSLVTNTAAVNYSLLPDVDAADPSLLNADDIDAHKLEWTAHGSLAGLLAYSILDAVTVDGICLTRACDDLRERAAVRVASELPTRGVSVAVSWAPPPGSSARANGAPGPGPPSSVTAHPATLDVPSGLPTAREGAIAVSDDGSDAIARLVADRTVTELLPSTLARLALRGDRPVSTPMVRRYERAGILAGTFVMPKIAREGTHAANADLVAVLSPRFAETIRAQYDTPCAAAEAVSVGYVTVVVRMWSP